MKIPAILFLIAGALFLIAGVIQPNPIAATADYVAAMVNIFTAIYLGRA